MDNKKRAQALWALLALLLALLTLPAIRQPPESGSPSPSPSPSPETPPDESPETPPNESPETDPAVPPVEQDPQPEDGGPTPGPGAAPEDDNTGTGTGENVGVIDDLLDEYPDATAAPSWLAPFYDRQDRGDVADDDTPGWSDVGAAPNEDGSDAVDGYPTTVPDMRENPQSFGELGNDLAQRIEGAAAATAMAPAALYDELKEPVTSVANDSVQFAMNNPREAAIAVGVPLAAGLLITADGPLPIGDTAAVTLFGTNVPQFQSVSAAKQHVQDAVGGGSGDSSDDSSGGGEEPSPPASTAPESEEPPEEEQDWQPGEGGHTAEPGGPTHDPSEDDQEEEEPPETEQDWQPGEGGHTAGPDSPTHDPSDDPEPEPEPEPPAVVEPPEEDEEPPETEQDWQPGEGGHVGGAFP